MQPQPTIGEEMTLPEDGLQLEPYLDDVRRQLMAQALDRTNGTQTQAAELLGMTFRSFRYYARKMGLTGTEEEAPVETTD
jgi:two-component system response regulator PilR (NtrC family)